jgi:hypothetical protein
MRDFKEIANDHIYDTHDYPQRAPELSIYREHHIKHKAAS